MDQMTLGDFLELGPVCTGELICCSLSQGYHWLKITSGHTPTDFRQNIDFELDGFENLYQSTGEKDALISSFNGKVKNIPYLNNRVYTNA